MEQTPWSVFASIVWGAVITWVLYKISIWVRAIWRSTVWKYAGVLGLSITEEHFGFKLAPQLNDKQRKILRENFAPYMARLLSYTTGESEEVWKQQILGAIENHIKEIDNGTLPPEQ